ncbi:MAG: NADPH:quinone oxidoreductase family protein [Alphaproteobacteria bacterium]|nr:NADPH:quinone oxidoreductase family protein [Alphaproteobacteria bacterium]
MRAAIVDEFGPLEAIRIGEIPAPELKPGHLLIAVKAAGVGFVDVLGAQGKYQVKQALPFVPGSEYAGIVEAVGEGVTAIAPGERVMAGGFAGAYADYALAPAGAVLAMPAAMSFVEAAGFRTNYATALHALADRAAITPGESLLVLGAGGGTGLAAIQIGKLLGARVIAAASSAQKRAAALAAGADEAVDYVDPAWREALKSMTGGKGVDVVFDPVGGAATEAAFRSLAWKGRHLVIGFAAGTIPALPINLALLKGASLVGVDIARFGNLHEPQKAAANIRQLLAWHADGRLKPVPPEVMPLEKAAEALAAVANRRAIGKLVLSLED